MEWTEILKMYGPQAIPWIALAYFGKWHLNRQDKDLDARVKMAIAIDGMTKIIEKVYERMSNGKLN